MFDGILFDLDGTLWDAVPEITLCWNAAISAAGVARPPLTIEEVRSCMGMQLDDIAARRLPALSPQRQRQVIAQCCQVENDYLAQHGARLYPQLEQTLVTLGAQCPLFVVSNCQDGYIQAFFAGTGLGKYFSDFECAGRTNKPKWENIQLVVARHGLKHPVYVGDTELDCQSARQAGVPFVHAAYGFGSVEGFPSIHSPAQLPQLLEQLASS